MTSNLTHFPICAELLSLNTQVIRFARLSRQGFPLFGLSSGIELTGTSIHPDVESWFRGPRWDQLVMP